MQKLSNKSGSKNKKETNTDLIAYSIEDYQSIKDINNVIEAGVERLKKE